MYFDPVAMSAALAIDEKRSLIISMKIDKSHSEIKVGTRQIVKDIWSRDLLETVINTPIGN